MFNEEDRRKLRKAIFQMVKNDPKCHEEALIERMLILTFLTHLLDELHTGLASTPTPAFKISEMIVVSILHQLNNAEHRKTLMSSEVFEGFRDHIRDAVLNSSSEFS